MRTEKEISADIREMELMYDTLFTNPDLVRRYNALHSELNALPKKEYHKFELDVVLTIVSVRKEIDAIRALRGYGDSADKRVSELCRIWPHYRAARRALIHSRAV